MSSVLDRDPPTQQLLPDPELPRTCPTLLETAGDGRTERLKVLADHLSVRVFAL
jgi:hypothetical protein